MKQLQRFFFQQSQRINKEMRSCKNGVFSAVHKVKTLLKDWPTLRSFFPGNLVKYWYQAFLKGFPNKINLNLDLVSWTSAHLCANGIYSSTITRRVHVNYTAKGPNHGNVYWTIHNCGLSADRFLTEKIYQSKMFKLV